MRLLILKDLQALGRFIGQKVFKCVLVVGNLLSKHNHNVGLRKIGDGLDLRNSLFNTFTNFSIYVLTTIGAAESKITANSLRLPKSIEYPKLKEPYFIPFYFGDASQNRGHLRSFIFRLH